MSHLFTLAKVAKQHLDNECTAASEALNAVPGIGSGPMGLTPDAVRATPEYRTAKAAFDAAFAALRDFNGKFNKQFAAELRAERRARDQKRKGV